MVEPWKALSALPALLYLACPADAGAGGYTLHAGALAAGSDLSAGNYTSLAAAEAECDVLRTRVDTVERGLRGARAAEEEVS